MAAVTYAWNPFQEIIDNDIKKEVIKVDATTTRMEFVPRAAPFFSRNFTLYLQGSTAPLKLGEDYVFSHPFNEFIINKKRNCFGSVVLLKKIDAVLVADYSTVGGPFTLDDAAFAQLVANIVNSPRVADWSDLDPVTIPATWPADPHEHPAEIQYDYIEMYTALNSLVISLIAATSDGNNSSDLLQDHLNKSLLEAHKGSKEDFGIQDVQNLAPAKTEDLKGNSGNLVITMEVLKEAFRQNNAGTLNVN